MNEELEKGLRPVSSGQPTKTPFVEAIRQEAERYVTYLSPAPEPTGENWPMIFMVRTRMQGAFEANLQLLCTIPLTHLERFVTTSWLNMFTDEGGILEHCPKTRQFASDVRDQLLEEAEPVTLTLVRQVLTLVSHYTDYILETEDQQQEFHTDFLPRFNRIQDALAFQMDLDPSQVIAPERDPQTELEPAACEALTNLILWLYRVNPYFEAHINF